MVEYRLDVQDNPHPESRLVFLRRLEAFLLGLRKDGIIGDYSLSTPYGATCIFRMKEEA